MLKVTLEFPDTDALVAFFSRPQIVANEPTAAGIEARREAALTAVAGAATPTTPAPKRGRRPSKDVLPGATGAGNGEAQETVTTNGPSTPPEHTPQAAGAAPTPAAPVAASSGAAATIEQARAAMNEVMQAFGDGGLEKVAEILNGIGFQRISEVTADKYPLVVEKCQEMLARK